jgi:acyl-CoA synthetase (AMP-forming)/AMP-acid ligase II/thioesterase domain-containing protein/acyl carrier protein
MFISELLTRVANSTPDVTAITAPGRVALSYGALSKHVDGMVLRLNQMGIGCGDRVAMVLPNGPEMAVAFLAVAAGATSAPLNPAYRAGDFEFYLSDLRPKALIIGSDLDSPARPVADSLGIPVIELKANVRAEAGIFTLDGGAVSDPVQTGFAGPDEVALVLHTSGTTSRPKQVPLTHRNLCASAGNIRSALALTDSDRCLNVMPLFHIHGLVGAILSSLSSRASVVCTPGFDAPGFFVWLAEEDPTWYTAVPTMHQAVVSAEVDHAGIARRSRLRFIRSSSSSLPPSLMSNLERLFDVPVIESYGMTEASHQMTSNLLPPGKRKPGSVGVAAGPDVAIMDGSGKLLGHEEEGEIVIRGPNVTAGYAGNAEANAQAFNAGWFRTGDLGRLDEMGYLYITGRLKEMVNRGGENIAPREVDEVLLEHPAVAQATAFAVPHPTLGEDLAAAVVVKAGSDITEQSLRDYAFKHLADFKVPSQVIFVEEIPKGPTGKLQRIGLADTLAGELQTPFVAPRNRLEETLAKFWAKTLRLKNVSIHDNFFALGGDSLRAHELFAQIEHSLGKKLPPVTLFHAPTIEQLASALTNGQCRILENALVPIQTRGSKPPLFFVHAHEGSVIYFHDLARCLGPDQPFYGLQAPWLYSQHEELIRIEGMAAQYIREIRTVQPHGPYFLGGWCLGGMVALEMAQQLSEQGEQVAFLVMAMCAHPTYPERLPRVTSIHQGIYGIARKLDQVMTNFCEFSRKQKLTYLSSRTKSLKTRIVASSEGALRSILSIFGVRLPYSSSYLIAQLTRANRLVIGHYEPQIYTGDVALFRSSKQPLGIVPDPTLGWEEFFPRLDVREIPGHSKAMLEEPRVRILAEHVTACLERARASAPAL